MKSTELFALSLLWIIAEVYGHSSDMPYLSYEDKALTNHSYFKKDDLQGSKHIICHTNIEGDCGVGNWFLPSGSEVDDGDDGDDDNDDDDDDSDDDDGDDDDSDDDDSDDDDNDDDDDDDMGSVCQNECSENQCCVYLCRRGAPYKVPSGIYSCRITAVTNSSVNESLYIGIYDSEEGD